MTSCDPEVALAPDHAPLAVQLVVSVVDHASVLDSPRLTSPGVAVNVSVGAGTTVTETDCCADPPGPVQDSVYVAEADGDTDCDPEVAFAPDHEPLPVQLVALVVDHASVLDCPAPICEGVAVKLVIDGGGLTVTVTEFDVGFPTALLHVSP